MMTFGAVAAAVLLMVTLGQLPAASALEQLAEALASMPCIKMTSTHDGKTRESWIMPAMRQSANRSDEWIQFFDANAETVVTHNRKTGERVRSVKFQNDFGFVSELVSAIIDSGKGNTPGKIRSMEVVSSKTETVDGSRVLTLELNPNSIRGVKEGATATARIIIDPATDLPTQCVATLNDGGEIQTITNVWSYSEDAPTNIYALGVDRSTKLVDRVPSTAVKPLLAGLYGGRLSFDDYVGVSIQTSRKEEANFGSGAGDFILAAKQGKKFLFARLVKTSESADKFKDKTRAEVADLVLSDVSGFEFSPLSIVDGMIEHRCATTGVTSVEINVPLEEFIVPSWRTVPHFAGRPPTGIGSGEISGALVTEAKGGPEGCMLLQAVRDGQIPRAPDPDADKRRGGAIDKGGYWVRADRDYLVMKEHADFGEEKTSFVLDSLAQSPQGSWYPTKATKRYDGVKENAVKSYHYSYHLDFQKKLPAKIFDPSSYYSVSELRRSKPPRAHPGKIPMSSV